MTVNQAGWAQTRWADFGLNLMCFLLLLCSLLLIFSLSDMRRNTKYTFDVHPLPTTGALEIENAAKLMHLLSELRNAPNELNNPHSSLQDQMIMANLAKVNEEIKQSSAYMNDQFNKKFILIGGLL